MSQKEKEDGSVTAGQRNSQTNILHEVTECISLPRRYNFGSHTCHQLKNRQFVIKRKNKNTVCV